MATSQLLGLESYVTGPQPDAVTIRAEPLSWMVSVYNGLLRKTTVGYFKNPRESEGFKAMPRPMNNEEDSRRLEVRVLCVLPERDDNVNAFEQTGRDTALNHQYIAAVYEGIGIPTGRIKVRYVRGGKLISVNMAKGTLNIRNLGGKGWRPPEPDENEQYDPRELIEAHDPPEPNDPQWLQLQQLRRKRG